MSHPIENIMKTTMEELKRMVDVNTIIGEPLISSNGTMIMPVSRVSLGFVSGGGEYGRGQNIARRSDAVEVVDDVKHPFAGVSAAGMSLTPIAFLVVNDTNVRVLPAKSECTTDRIIEIVPSVISTIGEMCKKKETCGCEHSEEVNT